MSAKHTAVELWKSDYWRWRYSLSSLQLIECRYNMIRIRREAALERALEADRRKSEALQEIMRVAINVGFNYGGNDGAHHKQWTIDQMIRILAGDEYERLVVKACAGEDGPNTYTWETGIAP